MAADRSVNMDDVARVLAQMDRKKKHDAAASEAAVSAACASAIGSNTPMTLLVDIRQALGDQTKSLE